jgi:ferredoxin
MSEPRVEIDRDACIGAGNCVRYAPQAFDLDDDDIAIVLEPGSEPPEALRRAEQGCPSGAIFVTTESQ